MFALLNTFQKASRQALWGKPAAEGRKAVGKGCHCPPSSGEALPVRAMAALNQSTREGNANRTDHGKNCVSPCVAQRWERLWQKTSDNFSLKVPSLNMFMQNIVCWGNSIAHFIFKRSYSLSFFQWRQNLGCAAPPSNLIP